MRTTANYIIPGDVQESIKRVGVAVANCGWSLIVFARLPSFYLCVFRFRITFGFMWKYRGFNLVLCRSVYFSILLFRD